MTLPSLLDNPYVIYAGWSLLVILWETSLVAALLAGWWTWRPRASAARRDHAAVMAFGAAVLIAAVTPLALYTVPAPTGAKTAVSTLAARPVPDSLGLPREVALPSAGVPLATAPAIRLAPALVLPDDAVDRLSPHMVAAVLAHEFAHIKRRDYVATLIQSVVELLLFFSPPGSLVCERLAMERRA